MDIYLNFNKIGVELSVRQLKSIAEYQIGISAVLILTK